MADFPEPLTITDAAPGIRNGELTPSELLEQCLRRIDIYEPSVQAWVYLDRERARRDAAQLTDEVKTQYRGPLHGIPIGIKDIIDVFDMPTGCGSKLWANSYARRDATVVERLRAAGAIILGKTVTTPYAFTDPPKTRNPWNLDRTPGGSSSGSAAAVACCMCLGALGTQTGGSLTRPASYCGVCSLKPTYGRVSVDGVLPLAPSLDHVGVMANCVRDLAVMFEVMASDGSKWTTFGGRAPVPNCLQSIEQFQEEPFDVLRMGGIFDDLIAPELRSGYETSIQHIQPSAFHRRSVVPPIEFNIALKSHKLMMAVEAAEFHRDRLLRCPNEYPARIRELIEFGLAASGIEHHEAALLQMRLFDELSDSLNDYRVLLTPAATDLAPTAETTGNPAMNSFWSFTGLPTVSIPVRTIRGLPFAIQLVGPRLGEEILLAHSARYESNLNLPRRLPPVPLGLA
jgi:Asp-tRNA(Asn)/Glu-tRNA(Gln) amidotransferase A subunit family amidase